MRPWMLGLCGLIAITTSSSSARGQSPAALRGLAEDYYRWRNERYPVASSESGLHTWDGLLTDYSPDAIAMRRKHVSELLARVEAMATEKWQKDDRIDWLLFRAQLEGVAFFDRVMDSEHTDPQTYVSECSGAI